VTLYRVKSKTEVGPDDHTLSFSTPLFFITFLRIGQQGVKEKDWNRQARNQVDIMVLWNKHTGNGSRNRLTGFEILLFLFITSVGLSQKPWLFRGRGFP
jgi:hypothetical protein